MPRSSRAPEIPQRPSPRAPASLRTSSSVSDPTHLRLRTQRSGGRSPRGAQSDPVSQKKLGTRIAELESQLGHAQVTLRSLKDQLSSAEAAKKAAQEQLEKKARKPEKAPEAAPVEDQQPTMETDVFEVQVESYADRDEFEVKSDELALEDDEMNILKMKLGEREKEVEAFRLENVKMKAQIDEKTIKIASAQSKIEEMNLNLDRVNQELEKSKNREARLNEKVEAGKKAKGEMEAEMERLRVQTEQWRKAADAAASVLEGEVERNERRISERCGSMENYRSVFESSGGGYRGYVGSPGGGDDGDGGFGGGKRKGSGKRMFGDLWRKKGHK